MVDRACRYSREERQAPKNDGAYKLFYSFTRKYPFLEIVFEYNQYFEMQSHYGLKNINNVNENIYKGHCLIATIIFLKFFHNHSSGRNIRDFSLLKSKYLNVAKIILLANFVKNIC